MPRACCGHSERLQVTCESQYSAFKSPFDGPNVRSQYAPHLLVEPTHIHATINFNIGTRSLHCRVTHTVRCRATHTDSSTVSNAVNLTLNAVGFLNVRAGDGVHELVYDGALMKVSLATTDGSAANTCDTMRHFTVEYDVQEPVSGMFFSTDREQSGYYAITDHETERARYWLACVDFPSVRTTLTFDLVTPVELTALANGKLMSEAIKGDLKTTTWHLEHVCPSYLICLAVGDFRQVDHGDVDGIPVKYFAPMHFTSDQIMRSFDKTPSMIKWLQEKLASPFPWPKYYQIAAPYIGGAMENISLVTWSYRFLMDEVWAQERKHLMDIVNLHEMTHTYFGDLLVIRHFEHAWLKESWATYMESVWLQDTYGEDTFRYEMFENAVSYIKETESYMRPIVTRKYDSSWSLFDSHTYPGGCWRIHMLRSILGDVIFWKGVRKYVSTYRGKTVETDDFRKVLESESGLNLTRFFDEWFFSKGFPTVKASYSYDKDKKECTLTMEQSQISPAEKNDIAMFHFELDVEITDENDVVTVGTAVFEDSTKAYVRLNCASKPKVIRLDPHGKVLITLDFNPGEPILASTAESAKDVVSRIRAYQELIKIGSFSSMKSVSELILNETHFGVRAKVSDALNERSSQKAVNILAQMLDAEKDPMAMWEVAKNCRIRDNGLRQAILRFLDRPDLPYNAQAQGLQALGYQTCLEDEERLLKAAKSSNTGMHNVVRAGSLRALALSRTPSAYRYLLERVEQQAESKFGAMPAAIESLASIARFQEDKSCRMRVIPLLRDIAARDENESCRRSAISGLLMLESNRSADTIWESRSLYAAQDWLWLENKVKQLRNRGGDNGNADLLKRLEEMETKMRALEEKVADKKPVETIKSESDEPKE